MTGSPVRPATGIPVSLPIGTENALLIAGRTQDGYRMAQALLHLGYQVTLTTDAEQVLRLVLSGMASWLLILDGVAMTRAVALCRKLRREGARIPVILVRPAPNLNQKVMLLNAGADHIIGQNDTAGLIHSLIGALSRPLRDSTRVLGRVGPP